MEGPTNPWYTFHAQWIPFIYESKMSVPLIWNPSLFVSIEIRGNLNIEFIIRFLFEHLNKFADLDVSL